MAPDDGPGPAEEWPRLHRHVPAAWTHLVALVVVALAAALGCAVAVAIFAT